jgi:hypothetical protein
MQMQQMQILLYHESRSCFIITTWS